MGHVSPRPLPQEGKGDEFPGREHRGAGASTPPLSRRALARFGETIAERFLVDRGAKMVARNARSGRGEVDLLVRFGSQVVAVEVKTRRDSGVDPIEAFTSCKARMVRNTARTLVPPAHRVDLVAVTVGAAGVDIRWLPEVA